MVLLGIVPVLMHTPPTAVCFSTNATRFPALTAWMAARCPPGPEPMTISSYGCIRGVLSVRFVRGVKGVGLHTISSIDDLRCCQCAGARNITMTSGQPHEMFLHGESVAVAHRSRARIRSVGSQETRFPGVRQIRRQDLVAHPLAKLRIFQRKEHL